jgi:biopolymer transport protein ExbD
MEGNKVKVSARKKARIEIIPLIDVIFFLLATFVLFTLSLNRIQSVDVNLPVPAPPSDRKPDPKDEPVSLQVSSEGTIFWNRELIDLAELPSRIAYLKTQTDDPKIMLSGDDKAKFGVTVTVLDEIRKAGIEKFSIETVTRPTGK